MSSKIAREGLMKLMYQMDINNDFSDKELDIFLENNHFNTYEYNFIYDKTKGIINNLKHIDELIKKHMKDMKFERLHIIDLSILRIAFYELVYDKDVPIEIIVNEAIENAKLYSDDNAYKYINAILGDYLRSED